VGCWTRDERPPFQNSGKLGGASSLTNRHPTHLLKEHTWAPRAAAPPCTGAASPPWAGAASPRRAWAAAPPRAQWVEAAAPSQAQWAGVAVPPPSPASLMARLTPCACLRKKKLLDSLLGDEDGGAGVFLVPRLTKFLADQDYIDKMANRQAVGHAPRNPCPLRRALGHKNHVVTRRRVTVHILFTIPNAQLLL
jgi:hypothetical protein